MISPLKRNKKYVQLCWVVPDLEASIDQWIKTTGAGPFFVFADVHFEDSYYRGQPLDIAPHRAAIGYFGDMQIELVAPIGDEPGIWRELVPAGQFGFHHTGLYSENYDEDVAGYLDTGAEMAFEGLMMGSKTCYVDTSKELGFMTEIITANPIAAEVFSTMSQASIGWDGRDPIRSLG